MVKRLILALLLCIPFLAKAESVNGSCLIGQSDYIEANFFYNLSNSNKLSDGIITIANGSQKPLVNLNIEITAESNGKTVTIYREFKTFSPAVPGYSTSKIEGINYQSSNGLSNIKISVSNARCASN